MVQVRVPAHNRAARQAALDSRTYVRGERRTLVCHNPACELPGRVFSRPLRSGPVPKYCSPACRQNSYKLRTVGTNVGQKRKSEAPRVQKKHKLTVSLDLDVLMWLEQQGWDKKIPPPKLAADMLSATIRQQAKETA